LIDDPTASAPEGGAEGEGALSPEAMLEVLAAQTNDAAIFPLSLREQYLFFYDMLLSQSTIGRFIKGLLPSRVVQLPNYKLIWPYYYPPAQTSLPSLQRTNNSADCVWGLICAMRGKDLTALESYLRVPQRYHRATVSVVDRGGRRFPASAYVLTLKDSAPRPPSAEYREQLLTAATERALPAEWLEQLRQLAVAEPEAKAGGLE
jgi:hypothetical protein